MKFAGNQGANLMCFLFCGKALVSTDSWNRRLLDEQGILLVDTISPTIFSLKSAYRKNRVALIAAFINKQQPCCKNEQGCYKYSKNFILRHRND